MGKEKGIIVFVTVPLKEVEKLVKILLKERVCACINIIENVKSYFWWKETISQEREALLIIKTQEKLFSKLKKIIKENHPYTVPEIVGIKITKINEGYLDWLIKETYASIN